MATPRTLVGDLETIGPTETLVVSPLNVSVSLILPVIVDTLSHGYTRGTGEVNQGVLDGHALTVRADGAGNVNVLNSHHIWVAIVDTGSSKSFTAEGNEPGNRWKVSAS